MTPREGLITLITPIILCDDQPFFKGQKETPGIGILILGWLDDQPSRS